MKTTFATRTAALTATTLVGLSLAMAPAASATTVLSAGDQISASGGNCTLGFVFDKGGPKYGLTAGHCGEQGDTVTSNGAVIGTMTHKQAPPTIGSLFDPSAEDRSDWAIITIDPEIELNHAGDFEPKIAPNTTARATVGQQVCTSGITTGHHCGKVTKVNGDLITTNITRLPGDSGGPLYDRNTGAALGVLSTGSVTLGGITSLYYSAPAALDEVGISHN